MPEFRPLGDSRLGQLAKERRPQVEVRPYPCSAAFIESRFRSRSRTYTAPSGAAAYTASRCGSISGRIGASRYGLPLRSVFGELTRMRRFSQSMQSHVRENGSDGVLNPR